MLRALRLPAVIFAFALSTFLVGCPSPSRQDDIVFVLVDTLRRDHLGLYGYARDTSPHLDAIASRAVVFDQARSTAPWTNPAIASLFTGLYPQAVLPPAGHAETIRRSLPREADTLAERLQAAGYRTVGLVDHPGIRMQNLFGQGFEIYENLFQRTRNRGWGHTPAETVMEAIHESLDVEGPRRTFLYLHVVYPHRPYRAPSPWLELFGPPLGERAMVRSNRQAMIDAYDGEIRYTDELLGRLATLLADRRGRRTWLIVTADHGEGFWEHGQQEHGNHLFDELLRVPMILVPPSERGIEPRRVDTPVSLLDLYPTVLDIAGAALPDGVHGVSLLPMARGQRPDRRALFSESPYSGDLDRVAVVSDPWKYISERSRRQERLHDILEDPEERTPDRSRRDLRRSFRGLVEKHRLENERIRAGLGSADSEVDPETLKRLEALGYADG